MDDSSRASMPLMTSEHIHEESDVAIRPLAAFLIWLVVALATIAVLMGWMFDFMLDNTNTAENMVPVVTAPAEPFTAPELQVSPRRDLEIFREHESRVLASTEWIDREQGVVRIPVSRAIELVAKRGFPDWPKADVAPPLPQTNTNGTSSTSPLTGDSR
jgi:hypothetical protein